MLLRLVLEGQVDDAIGRSGGLPQAVEVVQIATLHPEPAVLKYLLLIC